MTIQSRLQRLESAAEASRPVVPVPMSDADFIPHGFLGRQIVATINMLGIMREIVAGDPQLVQSADQQIAYLRCREVSILERGEASREISQQIGEAIGVDQRQTMPPDVFEEMSLSCREHRLPQFVDTDRN